MKNTEIKLTIAIDALKDLASAGCLNKTILPGTDTKGVYYTAFNCKDTVNLELGEKYCYSCRAEKALQDIENLNRRKLNENKV